MTAMKGPIDQMSDEALQCHFLGHNWIFKTDAEFFYSGKEIVELTQYERCDRGCGCDRRERLSVPDFESVGKPRIIYPDKVPYLCSTATGRAEYRDAFYARKGFNRRKGFVRR